MRLDLEYTGWFEEEEEEVGTIELEDEGVKFEAPETNRGKGPPVLEAKKVADFSRGELGGDEVGDCVGEVPLLKSWLLAAARGDRGD